MRYPVSCTGCKDLILLCAQLPVRKGLSASCSSQTSNVSSLASAITELTLLTLLTSRLVTTVGIASHELAVNVQLSRAGTVTHPDPFRKGSLSQFWNRKTLQGRQIVVAAGERCHTRLSDGCRHGALPSQLGFPPLAQWVSRTARCSCS